MRKDFFLAIVVIMAFVTTAKADVVINETNFPDPEMRFSVSGWDWDGNGVLEGSEWDNATALDINNATDFKGLELMTNVEGITIGYRLDEDSEGGYNEAARALKSFDASILPKLTNLGFENCIGLESVDATKNELMSININNAPNLTDLKLPKTLWYFDFIDMPKLTSFNFKDFPDLNTARLGGSTGIQDLDFTGLKEMRYLEIYGYEDRQFVLNSLTLADCLVEYIDIRYSTIQSMHVKSMGDLNKIQLYYDDITDLSVEDCKVFHNLYCENNKLGTVTLTNNPEMDIVDCKDNYLKTLIVDKCPMLRQMNCKDNRLMWLDMTDVVAGDYPDAYFQADKQTPSVQAVKISPTEVGLRVHDRLDVSRVLNLKAKGQAMEPKEIFVDGIRYFVIYNNGPEVESLVGASGTGYEYQTKWPYPFHAAEGDYEGDSKDDNLPVTLNVTSWTKHQAWIRLTTSGSVRGEYGQPAPQGPQEKDVLRSQDYDGKLTWKSSNENVVKVNAETGELTVVGAGSAIITISGAETDYRLAPSVIRYSVVIDKATPAFAFEKSEVETVDGIVPENKLSVGLYDGVVEYASSDDEIASVDPTGKVLPKQIGLVTITATGAETDYCNVAVSAQYTLNITSIDGIAKPSGLENESGKYNISGQRAESETDGIFISNGKKYLVR